MKHIYILAPLRGLTDYHFRTIFNRHFKGFDIAIAPFISPQKYSNFPDTMLKDILPQNNLLLPVIPQLLHNEPHSFLKLAKRLIALGYHHLNWNLGCPAPQVAKKRRGSGMLPYTEEISSMLDIVLPQLEKEKCLLSIKMRTGYQEHTEGFRVLTRLNDYPLHDITIHPRLGVDLYKGSASLDIFTQCASISQHPLIYNGDITNQMFFSELCKKIEKKSIVIKGFMIGRGAISNPFLVEEIKGISSENEYVTRLYNFHEELFCCYKTTFCGDSHILGRMKIIWSYLAALFPSKSKKKLKDILKSKNQDQYQKAVTEIMQR